MAHLNKYTVEGNQVTIPLSDLVDLLEVVYHSLCAEKVKDSTWNYGEEELLIQIEDLKAKM
jgi:hypothetical protein